MLLYNNSQLFLDSENNHFQDQPLIEKGETNKIIKFVA